MSEVVKRKFHNTIGILSGAKASECTPDESYFCGQYVDRRERDLQDIALPIGMAYNFVSAALVPVFAPDSTICFSVMSVHLLNVLICVLALLKTPFQATARKYFAPMILVLSPITYLIVTNLHIAHQNFANMLISISLTMMLSIFGILLSPGRVGFYLPFAILLSVVGYVVTLGHEVGLKFSFIYTLTNLTTAVLRSIQQVQYHEIARREYALLIQAAPAKIVRHSVESSQGVSEIFATKLRQSVCLSTDWRSYQALSAKTSPEVLSRALGEYYNLCGRILSKHFPDGNYYADWIADEFFVVAFAKSEQFDPLLVDTMIYAAQDLLRGKQKFHADFGFPDSIDIGISSGQGLIGMMGPDWHKKATALGEIPGRSRRYQSAGKLVRKLQGNSDRIIFGPETILGIGSPFDVRELRMPEGRTLRDLDDVALYYIEGLGEPDSAEPPKSSASAGLVA